MVQLANSINERGEVSGADGGGVRTAGEGGAAGARR